MKTLSHKKSIQYTLRHIPVDVDARLRREAKKRHTSLNEIAIEYLTVGSKQRTHQTGNHWLDDFARRGTVDSETQTIIEKQAKLDKERMKRGD